MNEHPHPHTPTAFVPTLPLPVLLKAYQVWEDRVSTATTRDLWFPDKVLLQEFEVRNVDEDDLEVLRRMQVHTDIILDNGYAEGLYCASAQQMLYLRNRIGAQVVVATESRENPEDTFLEFLNEHHARCTYDGSSERIRIIVVLHESNRPSFEQFIDFVLRRIDLSSEIIAWGLPKSMGMKRNAYLTWLMNILYCWPQRKRGSIHLLGMTTPEADNEGIYRCKSRQYQVTIDSTWPVYIAAELGSWTTRKKSSKEVWDELTTHLLSQTDDQIVKFLRNLQRESSHWNRNNYSAV